MKTNMKIWIAFLLVMALLMTVGAVFMIRYAIKAKPTDKSGWATKAGAICYLDKDGNPLLGWQEIEGKRYYFVPDAGIRASGWVQIGGERYYFGNDGVVRTGWQEIDGRKYYLEASGKLITGLCTVDGKGYYFDQTGVMTTGWQNVDGVLCYFSQTGEAMPGWQEIEGIRYCFAETGKVLTGWQEIDGKRFYFTEEGLTLSGWQEIDGKRYYLTEDGSTLVGWQTVDGFTCRFDEDGSVLTGWFEEDGNKFYFSDDGNPMIGRQMIDDQWYYFGRDGVMTTGWIEVDGTKYYCKETGEMAVGQLEIDGVNHFFASDGSYVLLVNKDNPVPETFELNLVSYGNFMIDSETKIALELMRSECPYSTTIDNIYRSKDRQQTVWNAAVNERMNQGMTYEEAVEATSRSVMTPGHSEHQTGLAVDMFGSDLAKEWLEDNCWEYGFIVRYPAEKSDYTGIDYEYWHFRYVGVDLALELRDLDMCLEEYMQMLTQ